MGASWMRIPLHRNLGFVRDNFHSHKALLKPWDEWLRPFSERPLQWYSMKSCGWLRNPNHQLFDGLSYYIILYHAISYYIQLLISMTMLGLQSSASDSDFAATVSHNIPQCQEIRTSTGPTMPTWEPLLSLTSRLDATCPVEAESLSRVLHGAHT